MFALPESESFTGTPHRVSNGGFLIPLRLAHPSQNQAMIDALKSDEIVEKLGGRFKLTALIQRRLLEIVDGARPLVEREGRSDLEVVIEEIMQDKITLEIDASEIKRMQGTPAKRSR